MMPAEYKNALDALGLTPVSAARFLGVHPVTGRRWAADGCPAHVGKFLRLLVALKFTPAYVDEVLNP